MNIDWFTVDWAKRWGLPVATIAIGVGAWYGAVEYKLAGAPVSRATIITVTETPVPPEPSVAYVTVTADPPAPDVRTVVKTVEAAPKTLTATRQAPAPDRATETVTETATATETERVLQVGNGRDKNDDGE